VKRFFGLACVVIAGCSGSFFKSSTPPQSIYQLSAHGTAAAVEMPFDLAVLKPRVRTGLDTDRIAALYADRRLDFFANARWSGPLEDVVQDLALQAFREQGNLHSLHTDGSAFGSGYWLEIEIVDFQAEYPGSSSGEGGVPPIVHVHLLARVGSAAERHLLGRIEADEHRAATENRLTAIVEAYNEAVDAALAKIVRDAMQALNTNPT
jgi:cholesterol transport system auxiliary component